VFNIELIRYYLRVGEKKLAQYIQIFPLLLEVHILSLSFDFSPLAGLALIQPTAKNGKRLSPGSFALHWRAKRDVKCYPYGYFYPRFFDLLKRLPYS